jgi:dCMP deaminase
MIQETSLKQMEKQHRYDVAYMRMAMEWAKLSHAKRKKVGALLVKNGQIISDGYNGTPKGMNNTCEIPGEDKTRWEVIHAEMNAIIKCARFGDSCDGATLYITYSPCRDCSKLIAQSGISRIVYYEEYHDLSGIEFLRSLDITVEKLNIEDEIN